jgi:hypothetical protein
MGERSESPSLNEGVLKNFVITQICMEPRNTFFQPEINMIAISGPSGSGKTTAQNVKKNWRLIGGPTSRHY